ncbi:MAG: FG-GAP repeat protein [Polyangiales bacterium]
MSFRVAAFAVTSVVCLACEPRPTNSVVVRFDTDIVRSQIDRVDVVFSWADTSEEIGRRSISQTIDAGSIFPGTLVVSPLPYRAGRVVRVDARLRLLDEPAPFVIARSQFALPASGTRVHDVFFTEACGTTGTSAFCTSRESCVVIAETPRCVPIDTVESLPLYDPNGGADARPPTSDASLMDGAIATDATTPDAGNDGSDATVVSTERPTWWPWHGARVSSGRLRIRWDRAVSPTGAVVVVCPGYTCASPATATRVNNLSGVALVPSLTAGLYNWHVETASGMRLSPDRVFAVRALERPTDEDATALGTTLWIDARDGDSDFAIGAPAASPGGAVTVATSFRVRLTPQPPMGARGFGSALANAGDLRGDGHIALAVATDADPSRESTVSIFESDGATLRTTPATVLTGAAGDRFGAAIAGGGDIDGDGFADLVISAPGARAGQGETRIQYGGATLAPLSSETFEGASSLGARLVSGCDFDGDGFADYAASSDATRSFVVVRFGGPRGAAPVMIRVDPSPMLTSSSFGRSMACGGDFNGDGRSDLVVGDPAAQIGAGRLSYVTVVSFAMDRRNERVDRQPVSEIPGFATAVAVVRDINADHRDDVIVTATRQFVTVRGVSIAQYPLSIDSPTAVSAGLSETSTALAPAVLVGGPNDATVFRMSLVSEAFAASPDTSAAGSRYGAAVLQ